MGIVATSGGADWKAGDIVSMYGRCAYQLLRNHMGLGESRGAVCSQCGSFGGCPKTAREIRGFATTRGEMLVLCEGGKLRVGQNGSEELAWDICNDGENILGIYPSKNGRVLVTTTRSRALVADLRSGVIHSLPSLVNSIRPLISPDGRQVVAKALNDGQGDFHLLNVDTAEIAAELKPGYPVRNTGMTTYWSPDSSRFVVLYNGVVDGHTERRMALWQAGEIHFRWDASIATLAMTEWRENDTGIDRLGFSEDTIVLLSWRAHAMRVRQATVSLIEVGSGTVLRRVDLVGMDPDMRLDFAPWGGIRFDSMLPDTLIIEGEEKQCYLLRLRA